MTYKEMVIRVSRDIGLPAMMVDKAYKSYWRAVREYITSLPLKEDLTDEEFARLRPNVNIPSIGKLYVTLERYRNMKKKNEKIKEKRDVAHNTGKADVHQSVSDWR